MRILCGILSVTTMGCAAEPPGLPPPAPAGGGASARPFTLRDAEAAARAHAMKQFGLVTDALTVISAESVTWNDSSLGCPMKDQGYMQVLVPGYRIRLRGPAGELDYHASARGSLLLCPARYAKDPLPSSSV